MNTRNRGWDSHGPPGLASIVRENNAIGARRGHYRSMRSDRQIVAHTHCRTTLPRLAFVLAGEQAAAGGNRPDIAGEIKGINAAGNLTDTLLDLLLDRHAMAVNYLVYRHCHRIQDRVARLPRAGVPVKREDSAVGPGQHSSISTLRQSEYIASVESVGNLLPSLDAINGDEDSAISFVVDHAGVYARGVIRIDQQCFHLSRRETAIRCLKLNRGVLAQLHASTIGSQKQAIGVLTIYQHVVDDHFRSGHALEGAACIGGLV